ncbi:MAG: hypothetical protein ACFB0B_03495 [Thermonemataceae bacterium]
MSKAKKWNDSLEDKKEKLKQASGQYGEALGEELHKVKDEVTSGLSMAITVGVLSAGAYFLLRRLWYSRNEEEQTDETKAEAPENGVETLYLKDSIFQSIKREIALFLVSIARQKLVEYLEQWSESNSNAVETTESHANE